MGKPFELRLKNTSVEEYWMARCDINIHDQPAAFCGALASWSDEWLFLFERPVDWGEWHKFRIEIDPTTMTFSYFMDDEILGTKVPEDADILRKPYNVFAHLDVCSDKSVTGHYDNVRFGPLPVK